MDQAPFVVEVYLASWLDPCQAEEGPDMEVVVALGILLPLTAENLTDLHTAIALGYVLDLGLEVIEGKGGSFLAACWDIQVFSFDLPVGTVQVVAAAPRVQ